VIYPSAEHREGPQTLGSIVHAGYATLCSPQVSQQEAALAQVSLPKYLGKRKEAGQDYHSAELRDRTNLALVVQKKRQP